MVHRFSELMFTSAVKQLQEADGSRPSYARFEAPAFPARDRLTEREIQFIGERDSFYLATVSETGWPYVQHRGGPAGFLRVLDERTLGFADYQGNRQFISFGNIANDDRVAMILVDYPNRRRLKILGHARTVDRATDQKFRDPPLDNEDAAGGRGVLVAIEGFDWNCPLYITPRFSEAEVASLLAKVRGLEAENAQLKVRLALREPPTNRETGY